MALASPEDGAIMEFKWCNKAFTNVTGYEASEALGQRGTILIGPDLDHGTHLYIIEKLMQWENFKTETINNRKCGETYVQRMSWTHLTDSTTGDHWWLCSVIDLGERRTSPTRGQSVELSQKAQENTKVISKIHFLELENARLQKLAQSVSKDANEDALTGLHNRRHFEVEVKAWLNRLRDEGREFAVLYIDLDRFKFVNDTLGHETGDRLLVSVATMLLEVTDDDDVVARLGGDEFAILRPLSASALAISGLADEILQNMSAPFICDGKSTSCGASIGVAIADAKLADPERIVAYADEALYHAKAQGKGRWSFFTKQMHARSIATKQLAADLFLACERKEFIPYFQPLVDARSGALVSAETLVRWAHPTRGILPPIEFLETAENVGILKKVDESLFESLKIALEGFDRSDIKLPRVGINVSGARLLDPTFVHDIRSSGIEPCRLTIEILESVYLDRLGDHVRTIIDELDSLGVTIALDDFGTGHASVSGLLEIRPTILKIDRSFIQPFLDDKSKQLLVSSIVGIGKCLGMRIVAEGVETEDHARLASELGCDYLQGYYFGRPMSAADLKALLKKTGGMLWPSARCFGLGMEAEYSAKAS